MSKENPILSAAKDAANAPTLTELEVEFNRRKNIEERVRLAAAQKEILAVCEKHGLVLGARAMLTPDGRIATEVMLAPAPRTNGQVNGA